MSRRPPYDAAAPSQQDRPELRIGDAERERATTQLAEHYAMGRISQEEHAERLDRIWAARTQSELDPVFSDLPGTAAAAGPRPQPTRPSRSWSRGRPPLPLLVLLGALVAVAIITHLPLILLGVGVWFLFFRGGCGSRSAWGHQPRRW